MRNPKFRIWDKAGKKWLHYGFHLIGEVMLLQGFPLTELGNLEVNQFTGLKDKYGEDIYEGDVLQWIGLKLPITVDSFHGYRFMFGKDELCKANAVEGLIIGNVYENGNLLKEDEKRR